MIPGENCYYADINLYWIMRSKGRSEGLFVQYFTVILRYSKDSQSEERPVENPGIFSSVTGNRDKPPLTEKYARRR